MEYTKLISWSYRTGRGLFTSRNDKDFVLLFYVQNAETEAKIEQLGYIPSNPFGPEFPFVKVDKEMGHTLRARSYGKIEKQYQKQYPDLQDKFLCKTPSEGEDLIDFIYTELSDYAPSLIHNYQKYFWSKYHIRKEAFDDKEFVLKLLTHKQKTYDGARIDEYQEKALPEFLNALKHYNKKLFYKLSKFDEIQTFDKKLSHVGHTVKVHTLKPSKVSLLKNLMPFSMNESYFWDGEKIIITLGDKSSKEYNLNTLYFTPNDDYIVKVVEEDSVTPMTEFVSTK
jgi:hypothetical protein|nr:MAG TPA: hypothetical protein [Caudoviricetes sp.]